METLFEVIFATLKVVIVLNAIAGVCAYIVLVERKLAAYVQERLGPMRVGWWGLLQPVADGLKLFLKEDIVPSGADKIVFILSPIICLVPAMIAYAAIPFNEYFYITNLNIGVMYILAISSIGVFGIVMAGWSSNSKYSLMGGLRSAAQMLSYEIFIGLSIIPTIMLAGSLNLINIVNAQTPVWFIVYQPLAFVMYLIAGLAETNRVPFDLPEAETELVAGFFTEYSGMKFAFFALAEYASIFVISALGVILFLGGWKVPFIDMFNLSPLIKGLVEVSAFMTKMFSIVFLIILLRWTLPRLRFDQLMDLGWKIMLPLTLVNILLTGIIQYVVPKIWGILFL